MMAGDIKKELLPVIPLPTVVWLQTLADRGIWISFSCSCRVSACHSCRVSESAWVHGDAPIFHHAISWFTSPWYSISEYLSFWTAVLKTLESPLDCKEIQPVHPRGDQSWVFIGWTYVEAETPILWTPDAKSWLIGKDPDAGKDWRQEERGTTEDEMAG